MKLLGRAGVRERGAIERGAVGLTTVAVVLGGTVLAGAVALGAADVGLAHARAGTAADAAALAGVGVDPLVGGSGEHCAAATSLAEANGAVLEDCAVTRHAVGAQPVRVAVRVAVTPRSAPLAAARGPVSAEAVGGLAVAEEPDLRPEASD